MGIDPVTMGMIGLAMSGVSTIAGMAKGKEKGAAAPIKKEEKPEVDQEEIAKRKRVAAMARGGAPGQLTGAGGVQGAATTTRKTLLGQ